eukprot:1515037-Rhodomonas_salina.2
MMGGAMRTARESSRSTSCSDAPPLPPPPGPAACSSRPATPHARVSVLESLSLHCEDERGALSPYDGKSRRFYLAVPGGGGKSAGGGGKSALDPSPLPPDECSLPPTRSTTTSTSHGTRWKLDTTFVSFEVTVTHTAYPGYNRLSKCTFVIDTLSLEAEPAASRRRLGVHVFMPVPRIQFSQCTLYPYCDAST